VKDKVSDKVDGNERPNCNVSGLKMSKLQTLAHGASVSRSFALRVLLPSPT